MEDIIGFFANIPGLDVFLILAGALMIGLDLRKLYKYAIAGDKNANFSFPYILPGIGFFTLGFMLLNP